MSNGPESSHRKDLPGQTAMTPDHLRLCRKASQAIVRGQTKALRRYLSEGLDPNSNFYDGRKGDTSGSLLNNALFIGSFECFKILAAAGAKVGNEEIAVAIGGTLGDTRALQHLLDSGKFDPSGGPEAGFSWCEYAACQPNASGAKVLLMKEICERERDALNATLAPSSGPRARRFL